MAQSYGILGQIYLGQSGSSNTVNVLSNVYSCPVGSNTIINSIYIYKIFDSHDGRLNFYHINFLEIYKE